MSNDNETVIKNLARLPFSSDCVAGIRNPSNKEELLFFRRQHINLIYRYNIITNRFSTIKQDSTKFSVSLFETYGLTWISAIVEDVNPDSIIIIGAMGNGLNQFYCTFDTKLYQWKRMEYLTPVQCQNLHSPHMQAVKFKNLLIVSGGQFNNWSQKLSVLKLTPDGHQLITRIRMLYVLQTKQNKTKIARA